MATRMQVQFSCLAPVVTSPSLPSRAGLLCLPRKSRGRSEVAVVAAAEGEFGARDPFPAEIESNFGNKVIGNASTEHVILVPSMPLEIAAKSCTGRSPTRLSQDEVKVLLRKVVGWRLVTTGEEVTKLQGEFKLKSFSAGVELFSRIARVAEAEDYFPTLRLEPGNVAIVELWSQSIDGLSENDFILAAKIDKHVCTSDLIKRNRAWA